MKKTTLVALIITIISLFALTGCGGTSAAFVDGQGPQQDGAISVLA